MSLFAELTQSVNAIRPGRTEMRSYDLPLMASCALLLAIGLVMVYSASIALADGPSFNKMSPYSFVSRQAAFMLVGFVFATATVLIPLTVLQKLTLPFFVVTVCLLVLVFLPVIGYEANGANRWINLGPVNFQPSELMKVVAVLFAADYVVRKQQHMDSLINGFMPMAIAMAGVAALLLLEPDLGALIVIMVISMGVLFLGGINVRVFAGLVVVLLGTFFMLVWLAPWRRARLFAYLDPWSPENAYSTGYQLSHSLIAVGRGEWFGVGLGASIEKLHYLPEAHTDFIVSVIGEELGFMGIALVVTLFAVVVTRCFEIGRQAIAMDRVFNGLVAQGVGIWFGVQTFINIGVCLGLLPTKGLTLPLISYGGSGLVMNLVAIALVARVDYENKVMMRGGRT